MADIECPYCGEEQEICHDDGYGYEEGKAHYQECFACEREFQYWTSIHFSYSAERADCVNGGPHDFENGGLRMGRGLPRRTCRGCGKAERAW